MCAYSVPIIPRRGVEMAHADCVVSYLDTEGIRHAAEVEADSLYEAAVLAVTTFKAHNCTPGDVSTTLGGGDA
jgi:hypothetical protein